jgi:hypothetical protein
MKKIEVSLTDEQWRQLSEIARAVGIGREAVLVQAIETLYVMEMAIRSPEGSKVQPNLCLVPNEPTSDQ